MSDTNHTDSELERLRNLPIRSEEIGFPPDAMIDCEKCGRANPPDRSVCLYCGMKIEGSEAKARLELRELENWENGFNVIVTGRESGDAESAAKAVARSLNAEIDAVRSILEATGTPLPIARLESEDGASILVTKLADCGIDAVVVSDEDLSLRTLPVRLRGIVFNEEDLVLESFSGSDARRISSEDLAIFVPGILFEERTESIEKRKRRTTKTLSEIQTSSDEPVLDIYSRDDQIGWRVPARGFDFSCLGSKKSLLVGENMEKLAEKLAMFSPTAEVINDYVGVRSMLEFCWPSESRRDAMGMQRSGFARKDLSSIFTTNNAIQFIRYSRLRRHLL